MQIGASAGHEDRRHVLMQCYDEVVRKNWAECARRGDVGFDVNKACLVLDLEALNSARYLYDTLFPKQTKQPRKGGGKAYNKAPSGKHFSLGEVLGYTCRLLCSQARAMGLAKETERERGRMGAATTSGNGVMRLRNIIRSGERIP